MSRKARNIKALERHKSKRSSYDRVLIVCEGGKTEPYYFKALIDDLKLNTANVEVDGDSDSSPRSVVEYAKKRYQEDKKLNGKDCFNRVYCVIDQDEHPTYHEAINTIQTASAKNTFYAITSVPCFEFWVLLHFEQTTKAFIRAGNRSPGDNTKHALKVYLPNYDKGDKTVYAQIKDKTDEAIIRAKQVNNAATASGFDNPSTSVPDLIEYLRSLGKPKG
jgi:hypothetical protein